VSVLIIYLVIEGTCYLSLLLLEKHFRLSYSPNLLELSENQKRTRHSAIKSLRSTS